MQTLAVLKTLKTPPLLLLHKKWASDPVRRFFKSLIKSGPVTNFAGFLSYYYIRFVYATSTIKPGLDECRNTLNGDHPLIMAIWHGQFLLIAPLKPQGAGVKVMVARHGDAEHLSQTLKRFGVGLVRGAGAGRRNRDRGGSSALRNAIRALKEGNSLVMTADIPPGPARKAGQGIVTLAKLSGRPIVPAATATKNYFAFDSWNRLTINLPFSTLGIAVGEPIHVARNSSEEELEATRQKVEAALNQTTLLAYERANADPRRATPGVPMHDLSKSRPLILPLYGLISHLIRPLAPFIISRRLKKGKEDPLRKRERFGFAELERPKGNLIWFHAASVGETNAILPLIDHYSKSAPTHSVLLTTGTKTSAIIAAKRLPENAIHQFVPLDIPAYVSRFLKHWRPDIALFVESEIWPNLIQQTAKRNIPLVLLNARMSKKSLRNWRRAKSSSYHLFKNFKLVLAQNELFAERFEKLGAEKCLAVGNLKIDSPPPPIDMDKLGALENAINKRPFFLAASTHEGEEEALVEATKVLKATHPDLLVIIVPRHPERGENIRSLIESAGLRPALRTVQPLPDQHTDIYIADTIGELGTFFKLTRIAFLGGSLIKHGGQNPAEAIKLGAGVLTGPHWHNFKDFYRALRQNKGCIQIQSAQDLAENVERLLSDPQTLTALNENAGQALAQISGAYERSLTALAPLLEQINSPEPQEQHPAQAQSAAQTKGEHRAS